ncbi:hypothetical protein AOQ84DRAFT_385718 [Glonium stellatum]|uniref:Uncharacterized protein n=1 Tax=Glonium stellatum TaxID=574774 RepID=A0A8E2F9T8_9PEZI|nr:hypothetical protein AOQ84DRAFT_385718 [Glonium stellatum]
MFPYALRLWSTVSLFSIGYCSSIQHDVRQVGCTSQSQPNPIASTYPQNATGTINGTIAVLPIPLSLARQVIPSKYGILTKAYRTLLPQFPPETYPAIVQAVQDHDVQASGFSIDDFSRGSIEFPFVDVLDDGYTSFRWAPSLLITSTNVIAIDGSEAYGTNTFPATFEPSCDAYESVTFPAPPGTTFFSATSVVPGAANLTILFSTLHTSSSPYPLGFFKNITNQPSFANGLTCDNMIRLFNTSLSAPPYPHTHVKGNVRAAIPPFSGEKEWSDVFGIRIDTAFIENNYLSCQSLQGYSGTGPGD